MSQRAKELIEKFDDPNYHFKKDALKNSKYNALICIDVLKNHPRINGVQKEVKDLDKFKQEIETYESDN